MVLEARSLNPGCWQGQAPSETCRDAPALPLPCCLCGCQSLASFGLELHLSHRCLPCYIAFCSLCVSIPFFQGHQSYWIRPTLLWYDLILTSYIYKCSVFTEVNILRYWALGLKHTCLWDPAQPTVSYHFKDTKIPSSPTSKGMNAGVTNLWRTCTGRDRGKEKEEVKEDQALLCIPFHVGLGETDPHRPGQGKCWEASPGHQDSLFCCPQTPPPHALLRPAAAALSFGFYGCQPYSVHLSCIII